MTTTRSNNIVLVLGALIFSVLVALTPTAPAAADDSCSLNKFCGTLKHRNPDPGDPNIKVREWKAKKFYSVKVGESSRKYLKDADEVYVPANSELWCYKPGLPIGKYEKVFDKNSTWHKINNLFNYTCELRRD